MTTLTAAQAAEALRLDVSRILQLCRAGRLAYTLPKRGKAWVITETEIEAFRAIGKLKPGRRRKPRPRRLLRVEKDGNHVYG